MIEWDSRVLERLIAELGITAGGLVFSDHGDDAAIDISDGSAKPYMYDVFSRFSEQVYGAPLPSRAQ